ncbi:hypothetical protein [Senegalimassilia anaerobia]|uniref:hypothetical protein n=1 Tax=Senegalimassilia anaerobia TaxID=1473216 RepID=UPI002673D15B|nr:hypothetical protein [Senegalimassilia anaerobia]
MKRKETIAFINETVDFIVRSEVSVGALDTKTGSTQQLDGDMSLISIGATLLGIQQLMQSSELDGVTPQEFVTKTIETACKSYIATKHAE